MNLDTELAAIWHSATLATGCLADAIFTQRKHPRADVTSDLDEAAKRMAKASLELRQMIADRQRRYGIGAYANATNATQNPNGNLKIPSDGSEMKEIQGILMDADCEKYGGTAAGSGGDGGGGGAGERMRVQQLMGKTNGKS